MVNAKEQSGERLVVLRFSSMGDVAIVASFLQEFSVRYPHIEIIMVSREFFRPFFEDIPHLVFHPIFPKTVHKGFAGLYRLFKELEGYRPVAVADLHENIRSRIVSLFFRISGIRIRRIDKGRAEKKALTRTENKIFRPLRPTIERYADVLRQLGFPIQLSHTLKPRRKPLPEKFDAHFAKEKVHIGIAPFAQYEYKMYPPGKMQSVIALLAKRHYQVFIFGGGDKEKAIAEAWEKDFPETYSLIGRYTLAEELAIISRLDLMISMDSSGMHMASLMGVPVVSIWGPTHPYAGFLGYGQSEKDCVQVDHPSRPNSVYGNKPCLCGQTPCMELITPEMISEKVVHRLDSR